MRAPIPSMDNTFVGRSAELAELLPLLGEPRLVTLTGPGGVGKSRLAARLAAPLPGESEATGAPTVFWAALWPTRDARLLASAVAEAAGLTDHTARQPLRALGEWIGDRRALLVLDTCEHLVEACADLVAALLAACPALTVLATSREPLGLPGEHVHRLAPLPTGTDALTLFLDRAATAGALPAGRAELALAAAVCRRLEGIPLALELAAAQLPDRPVRALAELLGDRLALTDPLTTSGAPASTARVAPVAPVAPVAAIDSRSPVAPVASVAPGRVRGGSVPPPIDPSVTFGPVSSTRSGSVETPFPPEGSVASVAPVARIDSRGSVAPVASVAVSGSGAGPGTGPGTGAGHGSRPGAGSVGDGLGARPTLPERAPRVPPQAPAVDARMPGPSRPGVLRATIGWSHQLCTPAERLLWARMSVFRSDAGAAVLRAVCGGGPLDGPALGAALAGLCRKSVVVPLPGGRYRMLDTVREYGELWLTGLGEGEAERLARRHAAYVLGVVRAAERGWFGPGQAETYRGIAETHADVCAALDHLALTEPAQALELAALVGFFWACCGHLHEAGHYLEELLLACPDAPVSVQARAHWALGVVRALQGDFDAADALSGDSLMFAEFSGEADRLLDAAYLDGILLLLQGRPNEAGARCARALAGPALPPARHGGAGPDANPPRGPVPEDRHLESDPAPGQRSGGSGFLWGEAPVPAHPPARWGSAGARVRCRLVVVFALTAAGRAEEARAAAERLRAGCVRRGESWTRAYLDHQLALDDLLAGRSVEAAASARRMIAGKQALGDSFGVALGLDLLSAALAAQGRAEASARVAGAASTCWQTVGHPQRGTPELGPLRATAERSGRALIGDRSWELAFDTGALRDPVAAVRGILIAP